tara:strand:- start:538 stop:1038 length:501 start_codon:yes stop_codon:yes gene_type:complete
MEKKISSSKKCTSCKKELSLSEFLTKNDRGTVLSKKCKTCSYAVRQKNASATPQNYLTRLFGQLKHARTKKKDKKVEWDIELEDVLELWEKQKGKCALTGLFMTYHKDGSGNRDLNASIDRIDPDINYVITNIQLVCSRANMLKHTLKEDELYWWAKNIVEFKENE